MSNTGLAHWASSFLLIQNVWVPLKHSCLEYGNIFVVAFTVAVIWEDQMSYFIGVKINIGPYVKWIKKKSENLDLIEHELYDLKSLQPTLSLKIPKGQLECINQSMTYNTTTKSTNNDQ